MNAGRSPGGMPPNPEVGKLSAEASVPLSLDVVRARIFYLAGDVESVSPPAAMLLRAVADAIDHDAGLGETTPGERAVAAALAEVSRIVDGGSGGLREPPVIALRRLALARHRP